LSFHSMAWPCLSTLWHSLVFPLYGIALSFHSMAWPCLSILWHSLVFPLYGMALFVSKAVVVVVFPQISPLNKIWKWFCI